MIRLSGVLLLALIFSNSAFCQKVVVKVTMENKVAGLNSDTIYYSETRPLDWDDFQGVPQTGSVAGAVTSSGFAFNANMNMMGNDVRLNVNVYTFFSKKHSWKKPNINSTYHLIHEQRHFDITRLSAQKFYNQLQKADFTLNNYNKLLTALFNQAYEENNILQDKYDSETNHSINNTAQLQWNDKIAQELKSLY